jgi:cytoskeletal protein RodZ
MKIPTAPDTKVPIEIVRILKQERAKQGLSIEAVCKKMGARVQQIEALESGNEPYFQIKTQPFMWFARLYAKKLGIELPDAFTSPKPPL